MPSLADISAQTETVNVRGLDFEVRGLSAADIAKLISKFPQLRNALAERKTAPADWFKTAPELIPILVAAAVGKADDPAEVKAAADMNFEDQFALVSAAWRLTMPGGAVPLINRFNDLMGVAVVPAIASDEDASLKVPPTK